MRLTRWICLLALFILIPTSSYSQDGGKDQVFVLDDLSGGLNTKLSPLSLPKNQGDIVENLRFDAELKSITKRDKTILYGTASASEPITGAHRLYLSSGSKILLVNHGNKIDAGDDSDGTFPNILTVGTSDYRWQWLTWHDLAMGTDGYNQPVKTDGTDATYLGSCFAEDAEANAGPDGVYTYKVSYYTSTPVGYEVILDVVSNSVTVDDNDISLSMIPIAPDTYGGEDVVGRKIYRTKTGGSTYYLLSNGTIANNTDTTLTDSDADTDTDAGTELSATEYPAGDATHTPPKGRHILVHNNRLWIASNPTYPSRLYYSEDASPDVFLATAYFNIRPNDGDIITDVFNLLGKLCVSKNNTIQKVYTEGDTPSSDWAISDPFSFVGCQAPYSGVNTPIGRIYLANNGLYSFNGQYSELISDAVTPEIRDITPSNFANVWAAFYKNAYYMAYTSYKTGGSVNNRVLILDLLTKAYTIDTLSLNVLTVLSSGTDVEALYSGSSSSGKVYAHTETVREFVHNKHSDFTGTFDDMRYIPTSVGGDPESPILELAWTESIDEMTGTIDAVVGDINRPDTDGTYISQHLTLNASTFDKLYWNETIPGAGGDVTFVFRSGATTTACTSAGWYPTEYTNASGSDVSAATANTIVQYRASLSTDDIDYTPTLVNLNNYVVRLTFNTVGSTEETTIPIRFRTGWHDFGYPVQAKSLTKFYAYYETDPDITSGTLNITIENYEGEEETFEIDLFENPTHYVEFFTEGAFTGNLFRFDITESSLNSMTVKKIIIRYDVEPTAFMYPI